MDKDLTWEEADRKAESLGKGCSTCGTTNVMRCQHCDKSHHNWIPKDG